MTKVKNGVVAASVSGLPREAFSAAVEIAKARLMINPKLADDMDMFIAFVGNELSEKFMITADMLKSVPKAIEVALRSVEKIIASRERRLLDVMGKIAQVPGLSLLRSKDFNGQVTLEDGSMATPGLIHRACLRINEERERQYNDFINDPIAFKAHYQSLLEEKFPGYSWMDNKCLPELMSYQMRPLSKRHEHAVKDLFYQMVTERKAIKAALLQEKKTAEADKDWRVRAVIWVSKQALASFKDGKKFSKMAFFKSMAKSKFEEKMLPNDVISEGLVRAEGIQSLNRVSDQRARLIKMA
jgi:hypothetical protein